MIGEAKIMLAVGLAWGVINANVRRRFLVFLFLNISGTQIIFSAIDTDPVSLHVKLVATFAAAFAFGFVLGEKAKTPVDYVLLGTGFFVLNVLFWVPEAMVGELENVLVVGLACGVCYAKMLHGAFVLAYSAPFFFNLFLSVVFVALISTPMSLAVYVTNMTVFAAAFVFGFLLCEKTKTRISRVLLGTGLVVLGVWFGFK